MGEATRIEWCDATWNPVRGCSPVSEGCRHCYAMGVAARFSAPGMPYAGLARRVNGHPAWTGEVRLVPEALDLPLRWRKPRRIFVNSMSDLFHEKLRDAEIAAVFAVMAIATQHTFIVLTKRAARMREWVGTTDNREHEVGEIVRLGTSGAESGLLEWPLPNVVLGVSVENQATADARIPELLATPAACRAVSYEPALVPVDFQAWLGRAATLCAACGLKFGHGTMIGGTGCRGLDWIVVGGESGPRARPCDLAWIRSTVRQCREAGIACFVKQLGASVIAATSGPVLRARKGGDPSEWPEDDLRVQEWPSLRVALGVPAPGERPIWRLR